MAGCDISRRGFLRASAGAAVGGAAISSAPPPYSPVGRAEAVAPIVIAGAAMAGGALVGAASTYLIGSNTDWLTKELTPEDLENYTGANALLDEGYALGLTITNANERMFTVMLNHLEDAKNGAWIDAKVAIVEALEDGETKTATVDAARTAVEDYYTTLQQNFVGHFEDSAATIEHVYTLVTDHADLNAQDAFGTNTSYSSWEGNDNLSIAFNDYDVTYVDETTETTTAIAVTTTGTHSSGTKELRVDSADENTSYDGGSRVLSIKNSTHEWVDTGYDGTEVWVEEFISIWSEIESEAADMITNAETYAGTLYDEYSSGDVDLSQVVDAQTFASEYAPEEESATAYAISDLAALGIPTDLGGEMEVYLLDTEATVTGVIAGKDSPEDGFSIGSTYDPADFDSPIYLAYDPTMGEAVLPADDYEGSLDGGTLTLTEKPYQDTLYRAHTNNDETADAAFDEFTSEDSDDDGEADAWTVDLSDQLDKPIADIEEIRLYSIDGHERQSLVQIEEPFTIRSYTDHDGNEKDTVTLESHNQQTADTQALSDELAQLRELREDFDEIPDQDGGGGGGGFFDGLGSIGVGGIGVAAAAVVGFFLLTDQG